MGPKKRVPPQVLEQARRLALSAAPQDATPKSSPAPEEAVKRKVIAALKALHPMD